MKISWKELAALFFYVLGIVGWCYFGGYMILTKPLKGLIIAQMAGQLSIIKLLAAVIQGFLYLSLAGGVWCVGYMLSEHFKED